MWKFFGGGNFWGKVKKRCGGTFLGEYKNFFRGAIFGKISKKEFEGGILGGKLCWGACGGGGMLGNFKKKEFCKKNFGGTLGGQNLGPSLKRGTRILILSLHVPSPPIQNWPGTSGGGGFSHGARAPPPTAGMAGGRGGGHFVTDSNNKKFMGGINCFGGGHLGGDRLLGGGNLWGSGYNN